MTSNSFQQFLEEFFSDGNSLRWSKYVDCGPDDPIRISLEPWIERVRRGQSPFCLPRVDETSQRTAWYVLCSNPREARSVRETLLAFIGPTFADFNGEFATLSDDDSVDQACTRYFGSLVFRLPILNDKARSRVHILLSTMVAFRDRDSSRVFNAVKPIGRLLRDLEMAIIASNEESANQIYAEIRSRGRLSATNLAFLRVRILSAFSRWAEILLMSNLDDLLNVRRPRRISEQIAIAAYGHIFSGFEKLGDPGAAIEAFQRQGQRFQSLVRATDSFQSADSIKFSLLAAVAAIPPNRNLADRLLSRSLSDADQAWCKALVSHLGTDHSDAIAESAGIFELAEIRYNEGIYDEAFTLYLQQTPTFRAVSRVLETAVEIDAVEAACKAIDFLNSATDDIQSKVLQRRVCLNQIEVLTNILGGSEKNNSTPIESLCEWFDRVDNGNHQGNLNEVLDYGLRSWITHADFNVTQTSVFLRQTRTGTAAETIRNAVPLFIGAFLVDGEALRENKPIYNALVELLIYDEAIGGDDLAAVEQLVDAILTTAPSIEAGNNDFVFAVDVTKHLWERLASPRHLDWALSMLDLLIDVGTQKHASLSPVLVAVTESIRPWIRRVTDEQWSLLSLLASDLGLTDLLDSIRPRASEESLDAQESIRDALKGKSIAVYSLTERIARRFGQLAEQAFDNIKIHYIHDKALTDRVRSLAQSADLFIINTWDAKHAATNGIKDNRNNSQATIQPQAKSASSLFSCLLEHAVSLG